MDRIVGMLALLGFLLALAAHLCGVAGYDLMAVLPGVMALHVGAIVLMIPTVLSLRRQDLNGRSKLWPGLKDRLPAWAVLIGRALFVYTLINFALFFQHSLDGSPQVRNGAYVLQMHGHFVRALSEAEFHERQAWVLRGFSGHWLLFYYFPMAWFLLRDRRRDSVAGATARI